MAQNSSHEKTSFKAKLGDGMMGFSEAMALVLLFQQ
jgi:hypothetical protein